MKTNDLEKQIALLCSSDDGFPVKLRALMEFDWDQYHEMKLYLLQYVDSVKSEPCIARSIFDCVFSTYLALSKVLEHIDDKHQEWNNVQSALAETIDIIHGLISPAYSE